MKFHIEQASFAEEIDPSWNGAERLPPIVITMGSLYPPWLRRLGLFSCWLARGHAWIDLPISDGTGRRLVCERCSHQLSIVGETDFIAHVESASFRKIRVTYEVREVNA